MISGAAAPAGENRHRGQMAMTHGSELRYRSGAGGAKPVAMERDGGHHR